MDKTQTIQTTRRVGQVPTVLVVELQASAGEAGRDLKTKIDPENYKHTHVFTDCDLSREWFRGWTAAKKETT